MENMVSLQPCTCPDMLLDFCHAFKVHQCPIISLWQRLCWGAAAAAPCFAQMPGCRQRGPGLVVRNCIYQQAISAGHISNVWAIKDNNTCIFIRHQSTTDSQRTSKAKYRNCHLHSKGANSPH